MRIGTSSLFPTFSSLFGPDGQPASVAADSKHLRDASAFDGHWHPIKGCRSAAQRRRTSTTFGPRRRARSHRPRGRPMRIEFLGRVTKLLHIQLVQTLVDFGLPVGEAARKLQPDGNRTPLDIHDRPLARQRRPRLHHRGGGAGAAAAAAPAASDTAEGGAGGGDHGGAEARGAALGRPPAAEVPDVDVSVLRAARQRFPMLRVAPTQSPNWPVVCPLDGGGLGPARRGGGPAGLASGRRSVDRDFQAGGADGKPRPVVVVGDIMDVIRPREVR
mmetsp:Transcript_39917/g.101422  ORF Transcript_39917/g.101422 Transcript_39917/m.101422 type:complete len:274 (+) Transcript_39917:471-1292(+)